MIANEAVLWRHFNTPKGKGSQGIQDEEIYSTELSVKKANLIKKNRKVIVQKQSKVQVLFKIESVIVKKQQRKTKGEQ